VLGAHFATAPSAQCRHKKLVGSLSVIVLILTVSIFAASAEAFRGHAFGFTFGAAASAHANPEPLAAPSAVAANNVTGRVYVLDQGNSRIEYFSSTGAYEGQFNGAETPAKAFQFGSKPLTAGIAVDNSCYFKHLSGAACSTADSSNGDLYVTDNLHGVVDKFSPSGVYLGQLEQAAGGEPYIFELLEGVSAEGVSVDASGVVWVYCRSFGGFSYLNTVAHFTNREPGTFIGQASLQTEYAFIGISFAFPGFAVDSKDNLYARTGSESVSFISQFSHVLEEGSQGTHHYQAILEPFDPEEASAVAVDLSGDEVFTDHGGSVRAFNAGGGLVEDFATGGHLTAAAGLTAAHPESPSYSTVYVADSSSGDVAAFVPEPPGPPTLEASGESVTAVKDTGATVGAEVNPRSLPGEAPTTYSFEYGPCTSPVTCASSPYGSTAPIPAGEIAPDFEVHAVTATLTGLAPHTLYHVRVIVRNSRSGDVTGAERTFTTQASGQFQLPDGRAWELVSPPDKHGAAPVPSAVEGLVQAAADGSAFTFLTTGATESEPASNSWRVQVFASRAAGGWVSRDIDTHHRAVTGTAVGVGQEYRFFSSDLSLAVLQPILPFEPALSAQASEETAFLRTDYLHANPAEPCAGACYRPLVTGCPQSEACPQAVEEIADVPPGTVFAPTKGQGLTGECVTGGFYCGPHFLGATPDLRHVVLSSPVALTEGAQSGSSEEVADLYLWTAGKLSLLSVLPDGLPVPLATHPVLGSHGSGENSIARNAVSEDGSRVVWSQQSPGGHLYLRDQATRPQSALSGGACTEAENACTVQLDAVRDGSGAGAPAPVFQTAAADDSRIFFTDTQRLTSDSGGAEGSGVTRKADLYECRLVEEGGQPRCQLTDLTPPIAGEAAAVQGAVAGASQDGSSQYFVAEGALTGTEKTEAGEQAQPGRPNLYLQREGTTRLVAVLSAEDSPDWGNVEPDVVGELKNLTARVSPNGRWFAFMSRQSLTGYDNRDAVSGQPDEEVYLYDAAPAAGQRALRCVSCDPTGARPHGAEYATIEGGAGGLTGGSEVWNPTQGIAANIPGLTQYRTGAGLYQPRYLSNEGRVFFNSSDSLVPQDTNGTEDVYQYEPPRGEGAPVSDSCTSEALDYSSAAEGCVSLISSGTSPLESAFLDASESGDDVFFLTSAQLSRRDTDTSVDVYDARVGGGEAEQVPPPSCEGDACQSPAAAPEDPTPGSLTFQGPGNLVPALAPSTVKPKVKVVKCKKGFVKNKKNECVKAKKKAKRASHNRRGK
jgi:hypothetical protein